MVAPKPGEIYIEFFQIGQQVKAVAVDATTGVEVTVFGPASVSQHDLQNLAVRKLQMRLRQLGHS
ncbi:MULTISPECIES: DUF6898 family protein [Cohaesibacter]|uniref:DUF6898 family protein n=1 Tax=Cohaesibacter TaxID=655352 RepID=UPI000DE9838B|nr:MULTISPECIES: serine hydroxymethyltransferase [Cohaesibacter]TLP43405.1 serine hydroxymethyltransferase [Cohaesibacter sp. CAU 1516]